MTRRMVRVTAAAACALAGAIALFGTTGISDQARAAPQPGAGNAAMAPLPGSLEEMLEVALWSNPDLLVAEAKVRQAQAELNQVRLDVTKQVVGLYNERQSRMNSVAMLKDEVAMTKQMVEAGTLPHEELNKVMRAFMDAEMALSSMDAQIRYALGTGGNPRLARASAGERAEGEQPRLAERPPIPEQFREALEKPVEIKFEKVTLRDVVAAFQEQSGIPFVLQLYTNAQAPVSLSFPKPLPLKTALVALHDDILIPLHEKAGRICFIVRDYGICVMSTDDARFVSGASIPPGVPFEAPEGGEESGR
jgi:hypothetical protein